MKKIYKYLLWDIDDTLIDFKASEKVALRKCFDVYGVELTDEDIAEYSRINREYWKLLEHGKVEKASMLIRRFDDFIEYLAVDGVEGSAINEAYQVGVGDYAVMYDGAYEICCRLQGVKKQYAITNGTAVAQERKLEHTGLGKIFDEVFISDLVGYQKPDVRFFDHVMKQIPGFKVDDALVIGDSLSSDMKGANNAGIDCCWFNPNGMVNTDATLRIDYEIKSLEEVFEIIH